MKNEEKLANKRHTLAHLLAQAIKEKHPFAKLTLGPAVDNGFYYDIDFGETKVHEEELLDFQKIMKKNLVDWTQFSHKEVSKDEALEIFKDNEYKAELINEITERGEKITIYTCGGFTDLCRGGHAENPNKEINPDSFMLDRVAGAYWRGDEKNKMLTRIYGLAFDTKDELDAYLKMREEARERDHKKIGPELDLFTFSNLIGSGLPLWTPRGTIIRNLLDSFVWELREKIGYNLVDIPHITKKDLYETSGHWQKFKEELFRINTREGHEFAMKPMNCPHHTQIYNRKQWSYKELPQRYASTTKVYRDEQSGELAGLSRVRSITQDDAHVFCQHKDIEHEMGNIYDIVKKFYGVFGFSLMPRISLHDPKNMSAYLGDKETWEKSENALRNLIKSKNDNAIEMEGEAAFYGPKIDFMAKDAIGREWQVATIQLDMNMPERFDLFCINEKGEKERIVMIHAAIMGSIERFLSVIIEHYAGKFPTWLSPIQVAVIPVKENHEEEAQKIFDTLHENFIRVEKISGNESLGKRIHQAKKFNTPYIIIIGDKEKESGILTIETQKEEKLSLNIQDFINKIKEEIKNRS